MFQLVLVAVEKMLLNVFCFTSVLITPDNSKWNAFLSYWYSNWQLTSRIIHSIIQQHS